MSPGSGVSNQQRPAATGTLTSSIAYLAGSRAPPAATLSPSWAVSSAGASGGAWTCWPHAARTRSLHPGGCWKSATSGPALSPAVLRLGRVCRRHHRGPVQHTESVTVVAIM